MFQALWCRTLSVVTTQLCHYSEKQPHMIQKQWAWQYSNKTLFTKMTMSDLPRRQVTVCQLLTWTFSLYIGELGSQISSLHTGCPAVPSRNVFEMSRGPFPLPGKFPSAHPSPPSALLHCHLLHETFFDTLFKTVPLLLPSHFYFYPQHLPLSNILHD